MIRRQTRISDRHDAPDLAAWFSCLRIIPVADAHARLNAARAACDAMRCPVCNETGAHRCDPKEM
jgi:hypothetical protein